MQPQLNVNRPLYCGQGASQDDEKEKNDCLRGNLLIRTAYPARTALQVNKRSDSANSIRLTSFYVKRIKIVKIKM